VTLAGLRLSRSDVLTALRWNQVINDLLHESSLAEILIEEGAEKGRAEGRAQGARQTAHAALEGQFGPLSADLAAAVLHADVPTLQ
jgi:hypothetical protein